MALTDVKQMISQYIKKYQYVAVVLLAGIMLMVIPEKKAVETEDLSKNQEVKMDLQMSLSEILSMVHGAGKVKVLLTQEKGEEILYQTDDSKASDSLRTNTVLVSGSAREETGLIRQINPPVYKGAVVLCQGADNASVCLALVDAVKSITGLTSDRITILKMK